MRIGILGRGVRNLAALSAFFLSPACAGHIPAKCVTSATRDVVELSHACSKPPIRIMTVSHR